MVMKQAKKSNAMKIQTSVDVVHEMSNRDWVPWIGLESVSESLAVLLSSVVEFIA